MAVSALLRIAHILGFALAVGSATVKVVLLLKATSDSLSLQTYLQVARPITKLIIAGLVVLTLSGIGWLVLGFPVTTLLGVKLVLVGAVWVLGPLIDHLFEPRFRALAPATGKVASPAFSKARLQYIAAEITATLLFYVSTVLWLLR